MARKKTKAEAAYERAKRTSKPGEGKRFDALVNVLEEKGVQNPEAVAASIGMKKYGKQKFQQMAAKGRKKK